MSINQEFSDTLWWTQQHQTPIMEHTPTNTPLFHHRQNTQNTPLSFNLNQEDETEEQDKDQEDSVEQQVIYIQKESMFEKPLTPSDVGKLNRLVIPKQHAEKYFPLGGNGGDSVEKGLLLSFEDESGKTWRFRYSYWNSSQSYVLTKGWSRFVKEKRLDAGDVVVFERSREDGDRFFVGWRRRNAAPPPPENAVAQSGGGGGWTRVYYSGYPYPTVISNGQPITNYQPHCLHAPGGGGGGLGGTQNQTTAGGGNSKTLRLFGVNLECQSDEPVGADGSNQSEEQAHVHQHQQHYNYSNGGSAHVSKHHSSRHMVSHCSFD